MAEEKLIWSGSPSQVTNLPVFAVCILFIWVVFPAFVMLWMWLVTRCTRYELTTERLKYRHGVLNKQLDEIELYRVRDYKFEQPLWLRLFGLGNIRLRTSDQSQPGFVLNAIRDGEAITDQMRNAVEACRIKKGVREVDYT